MTWPGTFHLVEKKQYHTGLCLRSSRLSNSFATPATMVLHCCSGGAAVAQLEVIQKLFDVLLSDTIPCLLRGLDWRQARTRTVSITHPHGSLPCVLAVGRLVLAAKAAYEKRQKQHRQRVRASLWLRDKALALLSSSSCLVRCVRCLLFICNTSHVPLGCMRAAVHLSGVSLSTSTVSEVGGVGVHVSGWRRACCFLQGDSGIGAGAVLLWRTVP